MKTGKLSHRGYGKMGVQSDDGTWRTRECHVVAWELQYGPVPSGYELDHLCRQHDCHEVEHLEVVTHRENVRRGRGSETARARHAARTHCKRNHPFTPENTRWRMKNGNSYRACRACQRSTSQRSAA